MNLWFIPLCLAVIANKAPSTSITITLPTQNSGACATYQACAQRGRLTVSRTPAGIYGDVAPEGKKCTALLLDSELFKRAKSLSGTIAYVEGVSLPRLLSTDDVISTEYLDRTLVEGTCNDQPYVIYVTNIEPAN